MFLGIFDSIMEIVSVPLGFILYLIYWLVGNYGWSIVIFAVLAKLLLLPNSIKTQKNQIRMRELQPKMKKLADKYHNDTRNPKYQQELQDLYTREGYNPMSGCLGMLLQFPLIFGLWDVVRQPLTYICNAGRNLTDAVNIIVNKGDLSNKAVKTLAEKMAEFTKNGTAASEIERFFDQNEIMVADAINANPKLDGLQEALMNPRCMIETEFMGINLGETASEHGIWSWYILIPIIAALSSFLVSFISTRMNRSRSEQNNDPTAKSMNVMMFTMPLLSLWIGYSMSFGVAIYWVTNNVLSLLQTVLLPYFIKPKQEEVKPKEKKLNYTQIEKMKRDREKLLLNGEIADETEKNDK